ncbi:hypothetical protein CB0940_12157 [Cercospora beticola]|uniref:Uncharacterized protein n=1 Tax=Cercospora beticola TaxID=122368 RepID=A0A2G5GJ12_CERBT|nr:hypothetical protein CB0940_12157 [Cercospora beticola]PIA80052.1 hypothetical protein CB0940_12157 [Cercospora beticola]
MHNHPAAKQVRAHNRNANTLPLCNGRHIYCGHCPRIHSHQHQHSLHNTPSAYRFTLVTITLVPNITLTTQPKCSSSSLLSPLWPSLLLLPSSARQRLNPTLASQLANSRPMVATTHRARAPTSTTATATETPVMAMATLAAETVTLATTLAMATATTLLSAATTTSPTTMTIPLETTTVPLAVMMTLLEATMATTVGTTMPLSLHSTHALASPTLPSAAPPTFSAWPTWIALLSRRQSRPVTTSSLSAPHLASAPAAVPSLSSARDSSAPPQLLKRSNTSDTIRHHGRGQFSLVSMIDDTEGWNGNGRTHA